MLHGSDEDIMRVWAVTPSPRTLRAELLRLCARIGYSPPAFL
jgi:hypothetical protein